MQLPTYLILGYYGARNSGDDMMLYCIHSLIAKYPINLMVISECPEDTEKRLKISAIQNVPLLGQWSWPNELFNGNVFKLIKAICKCKGMIVGGGDIIRDDRGLKNLFYTIEKILFIIFLRKKLFLVNVGIGAPKYIITKIFLKIIIKYASQIIVRDDRSLNLCLKNKGKNVLKCQDIVFWLPAMIKDNEKILKYDLPPKYMLVALRANASEYKMIDFNDDICSQFAAAMDKIIMERQIKCLFVPFQCEETTNDNNLHKKVVSYMKHKELTLILDWIGNLPELVEIFKGAEVVIGMRLHALILGLALQKKCISIPYDIKCLELCKQHHLNDVLEKITLENANNIVDVINKIINVDNMIPIENGSFPVIQIV